MKTAILFDLDGTLLDTLEDLRDSVNETMRHYGCPERSLGEIRSFLGSGARHLIRESLPGEPEETFVDEALAYYQKYYRAHSHIKTKHYDGILEALEQLKDTFLVAVVSNKPDGAVKPLCKQYFGDVYARGEDANCPRKPAPDMVFQAMQALGAERCIYVGDSEIDIQTARNAGVPCLSVSWGFRDREELVEAGAKYMCDSPRDMVAMLHKIYGEVYGQ